MSAGVSAAAVYAEPNGTGITPSDVNSQLQSVDQSLNISTVADEPIFISRNDSDRDLGTSKSPFINGGNTASPAIDSEQVITKHAQSFRNFRTEFLKTQVNKKRDLRDPCSVTVHEYSRKHYQINYKDADVTNPTSKEGQQFYSDAKSLVRDIPWLKTTNPESAPVR
jgi:hypothetical protein